jgi:hypothetical protein
MLEIWTYYFFSFELFVAPVSPPSAGTSRNYLGSTSLPQNVPASHNRNELMLSSRAALLFFTKTD